MVASFLEFIQIFIFCRDSLSTGDKGFKMRPYSALVLQAPAKRDPSTILNLKSTGSRSHVSIKLFALALSQIILLSYFYR
jgi:hypothetical protein